MDYQRFKYRLQEISNDNAERNIMAFYLGIGTGYRLQDILCISIGELIEFEKNGMFDIQERKQFEAWQTHMLKNPESKRKKPDKRQAEIKRNLSILIREYVKGKRKSDYAFPSSTRGGYIQPKSYSKILTRAGEELGLKDITGHSLRKTYAYRLYEETRDIEFVRRALGHSSIEITKDYLGDYKGAGKRAASIADDRL